MENLTVAKKSEVTENGNIILSLEKQVKTAVGTVRKRYCIAVKADDEAIPALNAVIQLDLNDFNKVQREFALEDGSKGVATWLTLN